VLTDVDVGHIYHTGCPHYGLPLRNFHGQSQTTTESITNVVPSLAARMRNPRYDSWISHRVRNILICFVDRLHIFDCPTRSDRNLDDMDP